ncbi:hypothetical protein ACH5A3_31670 [Streptomyces echinatus]|uniref:hypothetical protein n=1 Tax=Streptomyces echinatus TaxID=67293 RepID=UPI0037903A24
MSTRWDAPGQLAGDLVEQPVAEGPDLGEGRQDQQAALLRRRIGLLQDPAQGQDAWSGVRRERTCRESVELSGVSCSTATVMHAQIMLPASCARARSSGRTPVPWSVEAARNSSRSSPSHCCCAVRYKAYGTSFSVALAVRPDGATVSHADAGGAGASGHSSNHTVLRSSPLWTPWPAASSSTRAVQA